MKSILRNEKEVLFELIYGIMLWFLDKWQVFRLVFFLI